MHTLHPTPKALPNSLDYADIIALCKQSIAVLQHKIEEVQKAFHADLGGRASSRAVNIPETSANQTTPNVKDAIDKNISAEKSARISQAPPPEHDPECAESARKCTTGAQQDTNGARQESQGAQQSPTSDPPFTRGDCIQRSVRNFG